MNKSELFAHLNDISFTDSDPDTIASEIISAYENFSGRTLAPSDPVRVFFDSVILAFIQHRNLIEISAKSNLLAYASGDALDHIGAMLGVTRLLPAHSTCTARFSLSSAQNFNVIIPADTRITPNGNINFAVVNEAEIKAGDTSIDIIVQCTEPGVAGNGFLPGQVNKLVDVFPYEMFVTNITETTGGTDTENDENFRERIMIAPESFTTAGSKGAYEYYAKTAHNDIADVAVITPPDTQPGYVDIYPLMSGGVIPSTEIINAVLSVCSADDVRPDTDYVRVLAPAAVYYKINVEFWIDEKYRGRADEIRENVENAVSDFVKWQMSKLGRDINPSELTRRIINAGAKRCNVISPSFLKLERTQVALPELSDTVYRGLEGD